MQTFGFSPCTREGIMGGVEPQQNGSPMNNPNNPRERSFRTAAIILKRRDFGEADRLLTILTPQHGKLEVIAKGVRKPTSTKTGHVELYTRADMLIHRGSSLNIAVQAEMNAPYVPLREDLTRGAYANYAAELLDRFTQDEEAHTQSLFTLFDETLARLCLEPDPRLVARYFEIHLLDFVGYRPELMECISEHEPLLPQDQFFSVVGGGVVCPRHAVQSGALMPLPLDTLKVLRHLQRSKWKQIANLKIATATHDDADRIMLAYITNLLERKLQSVDFIRRIRGI
jgi:DNA repair protein RecO (recombination protein O)